MSTITRVGFPRTGAPHAGGAPFGSIWEVTSGGDRLAAVTALGSDLTTLYIGLSENLATSPLDRFVRQYQIPVSALTSAAGIAGTFKLVIQGYEQTSGIDSHVQCHMRVVDSTGTVEKGVLYGGQTAALSSDPAQPTGEFATSVQVRVLPGALNALSGLLPTDLVLIELGYRNWNVSTVNTTTNLRVGAVTSLGWLPDTPGSTPDGSPWIEFTLTDAPGVPTGLTATNPTETTVDLDWVAPVGGDAPTGYHYRIDGGAPVDVGNVLGGTVVGLTQSTSYTVEVRAYNGVGASAWTAPVGFTTDASGPPPVPGEWVAEIVIGSHSWEIHHVPDDPDEDVDPDVFTTLPLAGLRFGWSRGAEELAHPGHEWATIGIVAQHADDLADVNDDDPVAVRLWFPTVLGDPVPGPPEDCLFSFYGRLADMTCEPHDLGAVFVINAVGYTVDIAEAQIGGEALYDYMAPDYQSPLDWARDALAEVGLVLEDGPVPATVMQGDREPQFTEGWGFILGLLRSSPMGRFDNQLLPFIRTFYANPTVVPSPPLEDSIAWPGWFYAFGAGNVYGLPVLHAFATDTGLGRDDGVHFGYDILDKRNDTSLDAPPGIAEWVDGEVVITMDANPTYGAIDGGLIETDSTRWRRAKDDRPTEVIVARGADVYGYARRKAPVVISERVENLTFHPHRAAAALLPDAGEFTDWGAEVYRYRLSDDPFGVPQMMPNHADHTASGSDERARLFNRPLAVVNIAARHNPNTDPWVAGRLLGAEVTIDGDEVSLDFALSRTVPRQVAPYTGGPTLQGFTVNMWGNLFPRPTVADLSHEFSVDDYRLVRDPNA
jgi:hypothetical protein